MVEVSFLHLLHRGRHLHCDFHCKSSSPPLNLLVAMLTCMQDGVAYGAVIQQVSEPFEPRTDFVKIVPIIPFSIPERSGVPKDDGRSCNISSLFVDSQRLTTP